MASSLQSTVSDYIYESGARLCWVTLFPPKVLLSPCGYIDHGGMMGFWAVPTEELEEAYKSGEPQPIFAGKY